MGQGEQFGLLVKLTFRPLADPNCIKNLVVIKVATTCNLELMFQHVRPPFRPSVESNEEWVSYPPYHVDQCLQLGIQMHGNKAASIFRAS